MAAQGPLRLLSTDRRRLAAVVVYCLLNLLFFTTSQAYRASGAELLKNGDFGLGDQGWRLQGEAAGVSFEGGVLSIEHAAATSTTLSQCLPTASLAQPLLLTGAARSRGVVRGDKSWHRARIDLVGYDADGAGLYGVPTRLLSLEGDRPWRKARAHFRLPTQAQRVCLEISLYHAAGRFQVKQLSLTQGVKSTSHRIGRLLLLTGWAGLALWLLPPLYRRYREQPLGRWLLLVTALILVGVLLPQALRQPLESGIWQVLEAIGWPLTPVDTPAMEEGWSLWPAAWDISKFSHLLGFFLLATLLAAQRATDLGRRLGLLLSLALVSETLQFFVPMRTPRLSDLVVDGAGIGIGLALGALWFRLRAFVRR